MILKKEHSKCPFCHSKEIKEYKNYKTKCNGPRTLFICLTCEHTFSETANSFLHRLRKTVFTVSLALKSITDGMGFNACCRT